MIGKEQFERKSGDEWVPIDGVKDLLRGDIFRQRIGDVCYGVFEALTDPIEDRPGGWSITAEVREI